MAVGMVFGIGVTSVISRAMGEGRQAMGVGQGVQPLLRGAAIPSLITNLSRQGLIYIPALYILNSMIGVYGLVWAQPVTDILSIGFAVVLCIITSKRIRGI